jgi:hypothetical protein
VLEFVVPRDRKGDRYLLLDIEEFTFHIWLKTQGVQKCREHSD